MKNLKIVLGLIALATTITSCKDENQEMAKTSVNEFTTYVDSVNNVAQAEASKNWQVIDEQYLKLKTEAETALDKAKDKNVLQGMSETASTKYNELKDKIAAEKAKYEKNKLLFGNSYVYDDMKFDWVNKDNIASVYETFVNTVQKNKDSYSREDWDEIKLNYEALDTRKNTVEKEGLTSSDNLKIAALKVKFAPMYTLNRMGAKSEENSNAKK